MFTIHPAAAALKSMGAFAKPQTQSQLDAVEAKKQSLLDAAANAAGEHAASSIRDDAVSMLMAWAKTPASDLDEGETSADRLLAMAIGVADENKDGELSEDEATVVNIALNAMADYLAGKGVTDEDITALLDEGSADAGDRVQELLSGDDGDGDVDGFVFDAESSAAVMDSILDAVYKKKMVIRGGKKVRINKRVSGHVHLSAKQKVSIRKAGMKSRSSTARVHRMKSMKIRARVGL